ncbi:hypothetical protein [Edaphobacter acidisoli]|nr:hypothetical protein [Edaphobacter acidisoli]
MIRLTLATAFLAVATAALPAQTTPQTAPAQAPAAATAAAQPNLSGAWKLNVAKSDFGQVPPPNSELEIIQQTATAITIAAANDSDDTGKQIYILPIPIAATEASTPAGNFSTTDDFKILSSKAQWQGATLVVDQKMNYKGSNGTVHSVYSLSADGKTLTRQTHYSLDLGEFDVTYIFDKQ